MSLKNKFFLDTNVCIILGKGQEWGNEWKNLKKDVLKDGQYVISPLVLHELLIRVGRGSDEHFQQNVSPLRVLSGTGKRRFFHFPGAFVIKKVFGESSHSPKFGPRDFSRWHDVVLQAKIQDDLRNGNVILSRSSSRTYGFDFLLHDRQLQEGKNWEATDLELLRQGKLFPANPNSWAAGILNRFGIKSNIALHVKLAEALDAAYRFDQELWNLAKNKSYDFRRHSSDWIDRQLLFYLCDPSVHFVTCDTRIKRWTAESPQNARVILIESTSKGFRVKCTSSN